MKLYKIYTLLFVSIVLTSCKKNEAVKTAVDNKETPKELFATNCVSYKGTIQLPYQAESYGRITNMEIDKTGNIYVSDQFLGNIITKYNAEGALQWDASASGYNKVLRMDIDGRGTVYVLAEPGPLFETFTTYLEKINGTNGYFISRTELSTVVSRKGIRYTGMDVDEAGNTYLIGSYNTGFEPHVDGQPDKPLPGSGFVFQKWDASGKQVLHKLLLGASLGGVAKLTDIRITADGGFIITGWKLNNDNTGSFFVTKYNSMLKQVWLTPAPGKYSNQSYPETISGVSGKGDLYMVATIYGNTYDYLTKFNEATGKFIWHLDLQGLDHGIGRRDMAIDAQGGVYFTGRYSGNPDFEPGSGVYHLKNANLGAMFIDKYNNNGQFVGAVGFYSTEYGLAENSNAICIDKSNNIYHAGLFEDEVDFDPTSKVKKVKPKNSSSVFVNKLSSCQ